MNEVDCKKLYQKLILDNANSLIISHKNRNDRKYSYRFKHHTLDADSTERLVSLLIDNIIFYSYSNDEIVTKFDSLGAEDLRAAAARALGERLAKRQVAKSDGLVGELMLDILVQKLNVSCCKIMTRAKYVQQDDNQEIKGYDSAFFLKADDGAIELWLGQAKAGALKYCKEGICNDINKDRKYLDRYFCKALRYICDRATEEVKDKDLLEIINILNLIITQSYKEGLPKEDRERLVESKIMSILAQRNVSIVVPCLLMFDTDIYKTSKIFSERIENLCSEIYEYFEEKDLICTDAVAVKVLIIMLPIDSLNGIKEEIVNFKRMVQ